MNDLAICPQCGRPGITLGSRRYYSRGWPAKCRECGSLAYDRPHAVVTMLSALFDLVGLPLLIFLWILFPRTGSIVAISSISLFIFFWWRRRKRPRPVNRFRPIAPDSSRRSRRFTYLTIIIVLSIVGVVLFLAAQRP